MYIIGVLGTLYYSKGRILVYKLTAGGGHHWGSSMPFARQTGMTYPRHAGGSLFDVNARCVAGFNGCSVSFHAKVPGWSLSHFRAFVFDGTRQF